MEKARQDLKKKMEECCNSVGENLCRRIRRVFNRATDGLKGAAGPAGTDSVQSKPDGRSRRVVVGQEDRQVVLDRLVETLHSRDLRQ